MTEGIPREYSDLDESASGPRARRLYAVDSASQPSSVTLLWDGELLTRTYSVGDSSGRLIPDLDELLEEVGGRLSDLDGLVVIAGPGSFTGLRVGLATLLGLHESTGVAATAVTTFRALAWQARRRLGPSERPILTAVDALRGERFVQSFDGDSLDPLSEAHLLSNADVVGRSGALVTGFGMEALFADGDRRAPDAELLPAEALAPDLAALASRPGFAFAPASLTEPLYLRPAAVTRAPGR